MLLSHRRRRVQSSSTKTRTRRVSLSSPWRSSTGRDTSVTSVGAFPRTQRTRMLPLSSAPALAPRPVPLAAIRVNTTRRQDLRRMKPADVGAGVRAVRRRMPKPPAAAPGNLALRDGCPAGKFLPGSLRGPASNRKTCNARCLGCLSLQKNSGINCTQERIAFTPTSAEIAEEALFHIGRVEAVVSFGQGCEGEPLSAAVSLNPPSGLSVPKPARHHQPQHQREPSGGRRRLCDAASTACASA